MEMTFEIKQQVAILSERNSGWCKELNIVSWDGKPGKFDIREWSPEHEKMGKGVTMTEDEVWALYEALKKYFGEESISSVEKKPDGDIGQLFFGKK